MRPSRFDVFDGRVFLLLHRRLAHINQWILSTVIKEDARLLVVFLRRCADRCRRACGEFRDNCIFDKAPSHHGTLTQVCLEKRIADSGIGGSTPRRENTGAPPTGTTHYQPGFSNQANRLILALAKYTSSYLLGTNPNSCISALGNAALNESVIAFDKCRELRALFTSKCATMASRAAMGSRLQMACSSG
jgi:hypothetical protein